MEKIKCPKCNKVLFHGAKGKIEIKCTRCKSIFLFEFEAEKEGSSVKHTLIQEGKRE